MGGVMSHAVQISAVDRWKWLNQSSHPSPLYTPDHRHPTPVSYLVDSWMASDRLVLTQLPHHRRRFSSHLRTTAVLIRHFCQICTETAKQNYLSKTLVQNKTAIASC